jgi:isopentenyldiphosphate isomerase
MPMPTQIPTPITPNPVDDPEELFDTYDDNLNHLGVKPRSLVHREGDWHQSFHCWIIYRDADGQDYMLVQRRAPGKDTFPNKLDITVAGHLSAGENPQHGVREIEEELGLKVVFNDLIPVGMRVNAVKPSPQMIDREFNHVFLLIHTQPLEAYRPNVEVSGLARFKIDAGLAMCSGQVTYIQAEYLDTASHTINTVTLTWDDFIPDKDRYLYKILVLAKRCLNGENHLVI